MMRSVAVRIVLSCVAVGKICIELFIFDEISIEGLTLRRLVLGCLV